MSADRTTAPDVGLTEAERELLDGAVTEDFDHDYDHSNPVITRTVEAILSTRLAAAGARAEAAEAMVAAVDRLANRWALGSDHGPGEYDNGRWHRAAAVAIRRALHAALAGPEET